MNRPELQKLANDRVADAKALLGARRWSAAYYLAGYSVECALKSCVLVRLAMSAEVIFDDRRFSEKCWTHNLVQLLDLADLTTLFAAACSADVELSENWKVIKRWNESSRYARATKANAEDLVNAIADKAHGVLSWIKPRW